MKNFNLTIPIKNILLFFILLTSSSPIYALIKDSTTFKSSFNKAVTLYDKGNYDEALNLFEQIYLDQSRKSDNDSIWGADILANIGAINVQLALYDKAINYYLKAEAIYTSKGKSKLMKLASNQVNLANCYLRNSDIEKARSYYENADRIFQRLGHTNSYEYETLLINLSSFYADNLNYPKALEYNDKAFKISTKYRKDYFKWISRGYIFYKTKDYKKCIFCYNNALKAMERDHGFDYSGKDQILLNLGQVYLDLNQFDIALDNLLKCKDLISKISGQTNASFSLCLNKIGQVYQKRSQTTNDLDQFLDKRKKDITLALHYYQQSLFAITPDFKDFDLSENPKIESVIDKTQLLVCLKNKAEALRELAELEEKTGNKSSSIKYLTDALKSYQLSNQVIHFIRTGFINQESRLFLAENEHSFYLGAIEAGVSLFELTHEQVYFEQAFEFSERSRSTDFLTMVRNTKARQIAGMPDSLIQKENELKSEIAAYKNFIFNESNRPNRDLQKMDLWKNKIFDLEHSYGKLNAYFEKEFPKYYDFKYADPITSLNEVQSKLKQREALIEYVVMEPDDRKSEILFFFITRNKFKIFRKDIDSCYHNSINSVLLFLKNKSPYNTRKEDYISYSTNAFKLYNLLISPFEKEIEGYRLVIIPDGKLSYLPFDAFLTSPPNTSKMDFRDLKYLIYNHAVSYAYSATLLYSYLYNGKRATHSLGAFLPKYTSEIKPKNNINEEQFLALPGASIEVAGISKLIKSDIFADNKATKQNFKIKACDFDILHLAMHTIINDSLPMYSKLIFSNNMEDSGALNTYEIYNMNLKSRLTVLSACNTGSGKLAKGEGVMSLARAFLYAGCPSILMTLWNVEDESSAKLMINFYENLLSGYSKDEALKKAKIKHLQTSDPLRAHPYYWLGYVSIGDQNPLFHTKIMYLFGMFVFIILIIISEKLYRYLKIKKQVN